MIGLAGGVHCAGLGVGGYGLGRGVPTSAGASTREQPDGSKTRELAQK